MKKRSYQQSTYEDISRNEKKFSGSEKMATAKLRPVAPRRAPSRPVTPRRASEENIWCMVAYFQ